MGPRAGFGLRAIGLGDVKNAAICRRKCFAGVSSLSAADGHSWNAWLEQLTLINGLQNDLFSINPRVRSEVQGTFVEHFRSGVSKNRPYLLLLSTVAFRFYLAYTVVHIQP